MDQSPFFITVSSRGTFDAIVGEPETGLPLFEEGDTEGVPGRGSVKRIQGLGFLNDPNDFAQALVATIPLLFVAWRPRRFLRNAVLVLPPLAAFTWGILLTRSRGGLLGLLGLLPIAVLLNLPRRLRRPAIAASALLAIPAFVGLFGYAQADSSAASRLEAWSSGLLMLKSSPLWGVGLGFFTDHHERVAHNSMVQCFAETGLVGYFLWLGFVVVTLDRLSWLVDHGADPALARWAGALRLSILGFLTCALFLSRTTSPMLFYLAGLPAALGSVTRAWGQRLPTNRFWPLKTLALESVSILLVWVTARAFH